MTMRRSIFQTISLCALAALYGGPLYATGPTPSTMFSVAVLQDLEPTFTKQLEIYNKKDYDAGTCTKNPPSSTNIDPHFPLQIYVPGTDKYMRIFYECTTPKKELFQAFGDASLVTIIKASAMMLKEPLRVTEDTAMRPPPGGGCSLTLCQNGTYRKTSNWLMCTQC